MDMDHAYHTRELAKTYESQGYYRQALDIYTQLDQKFHGNDTDLEATCRRLETLLAEKKSVNSKIRLTALVEDWLKLWWQTHHLTTLDTLMSQVRRQK
jgi:hypothetical protein